VDSRLRDDIRNIKVEMTLVSKSDLLEESSNLLTIVTLFGNIDRLCGERYVVFHSD
jgi:hypothetical protein